MTILTLPLTLTSLAGRIMLHCMHDSVRAQRLGSWTWTVLVIVAQIAGISGLVLSRSDACEVARVVAIAQAAGTCMMTWTHGMRLAHKGALVLLLGLRELIEIAICVDDAAVALAPVALLISATLMQVAELYLRRSYAKQYGLAEDTRRLEERTAQLEEKLEERLEERLDEDKRRLHEDKRRLEERNEQLQAEKERLFYDMQRRGGPLDNSDDRSVIRRGLLAGLRLGTDKAGARTTTGSTSSESRGSGLSEPEVEAEQKSASTINAPWDSPASLRSLPPSLPPGPPSSTASGSTRSGAACSGVVPAAPAVLAAPIVGPSPSVRHASSSAPGKKRAKPESASALSAKKAFTSPYVAFCQEQRPLLPPETSNRDREKILGVLAP